jgi:PhnB protein
MQLNPHLNFDGQCEAAFKFYEKALGGKIQYLKTYAESPMGEKMSPEWREKIIHATLKIGDLQMMGSDAPPEHYRKPQGVTMSVSVEDPAQADRAFQALAEGAQVQMPIQETFWARRFGMLTDRFGIPWMVNCGKPTE